MLPLLGGMKQVQLLSEADVARRKAQSDVAVAAATAPGPEYEQWFWTEFGFLAVPGVIDE